MEAGRDRTPLLHRRRSPADADRLPAWRNHDAEMGARRYPRQSASPAGFKDRRQGRASRPACGRCAGEDRACRGKSVGHHRERSRAHGSRTSSHSGNASGPAPVSRTFASTTCGTRSRRRLSQSGQGLPMIGKLLGHTQVQTTARYAHLAADPVRDAADQVASRIAASLNQAA